MKKTLILLVIAFMYVCGAFSQRTYRTILVKNRRPAMETGMKSVTPFIDVVGYQWDDAITLNWGSSCRSMDIVILNVATLEVVYSETKAIQIGNTTKINTLDLKSGEYEIQLLPNGKLSVTMSFKIE